LSANPFILIEVTMRLDSFWSLPIFKNDLLSWAVAFGTTMAVLLALIVTRRLIRRYHKRLLATERVEFLELPAEALARTGMFFMTVGAACAGLMLLDMSARTRALLDSVLTIALLWQIGLWCSAGASAWLARKRHATVVTDRAAAGSLGVVDLLPRC
jgi:hypothetical protein